MIVFDLDGTLIDTKEMHHHTFAQALSEYDPTLVYHPSTYEGLSTRQKLKKMIPSDIEKQQNIWKRKQELTLEWCKNNVRKNDHLIQVLQALATSYTLCLATNCIRLTMETLCSQLGIDTFFTQKYCNEDIQHPKPYPDIYLQSMKDASLLPQHVLIIEDSPVGIIAAKASGAYVMKVESPEDIHLNTIQTYIKIIESKVNKLLVIPMAGKGSRFQQTGYRKPAIPLQIDAKYPRPMIQIVLENLTQNVPNLYVIFIMKDKNDLELIPDSCPFLWHACFVSETTEGALCSMLLARFWIQQPVFKGIIVANCDQYIQWKKPVHTIYDECFDKNNVAGWIFTFPSSDPKFSYAQVNDRNDVLAVAEKVVISNQASMGIYLFQSGAQCVKYADNMIQLNKRVNNEFYICPIYQEYINNGHVIQTYDAGTMFCLGTPEDLNHSMKQLTTTLL